MHLLYVDMSGTVGNPRERHFIMAGVAVYETAVFHVIQELDALLRDQLGPETVESMELHGNEMLGGRKSWRSVPREKRERLFDKALAVLTGASARSLRAFGIVIEKAAIEGEDPVEFAYEQLCSRFDQFLRRNYLRRNERQRGLLIVDKSRYEDTLQALARDWRVGGTRWGNLRNLAEVPLFVDSKATRLVQLADLLSYALWRRYEKGEVERLMPIIDAFDQEGGVMHGLYHHKLPDRPCDCAACASRRFNR